VRGGPRPESRSDDAKEGGGGSAHVKFAAKKLAPKARLEEAPSVVMPKLGSSDAVLGSYPRVEQHHAGDPPVAVRVEQGGGSAVAQAPNHDFLQPGGRDEVIDGCADILG